MEKAFVFSLEASITLILTAVLISSIHYMRLPTFSDVYLYELVNDFQQITAENMYSETVAFSNGDPFSKQSLEAEYSSLISQLGDYCLKVEAEGNKVEINCDSKRNSFAKRFHSSRLWFDGNGFFELKMDLLA
ncbi:MAG: hypothetical protein ABIG96_03725 [Candidatus Micrarchaeota archaeon]